MKVLLSKRRNSCFCNYEFFTDYLPVQVSYKIFYCFWNHYLRFPSEFLDKLSTTISNAILGLVSGIPACCVLQFLRDNRFETQKGNPNAPYFVCRKCQEKKQYWEVPFYVWNGKRITTYLISERSHAHLFTLDEQFEEVVE